MTWTDSGHRQIRFALRFLYSNMVCNVLNKKFAAEVQCTLPPHGGEKKQLKMKGISLAESCRNPTQKRDSCNSMQGILDNEATDRIQARNHTVCYKQKIQVS